LFGARNVFRGVFNDSIKYFSSHKILEKLKMNREKLIIFALLLGSDYTEGIKGIGIVNAMEILKIFGNFDKL
jgi:DNA excision repair protein ERCC-5